jgi:LmbE family N-acetylglucosaminyl deacetylase
MQPLHPSTMSPSPPLPHDANAWRDWVQRFAELLHAQSDPPAPSPSVGAAGHVLVVAPHPDDECIVGALPLRLRQEAGWRVTVLAVTLGSRAERRAERWAEMGSACATLGFALLGLGERGLEGVRADTATSDPALWQVQIDAIVAALRGATPELVLLPHAADANPTHIGVHHLVRAALAQARYAGLLAETEFWAPQAVPNCMVQTSVADTARLVQALACHVGEVARNPYHLRLPAWMADNVRRGGELLGGAGGMPPAWAFATLYRLSRWAEGHALPQELPPLFYPADRSIELPG